MDDWTPDSTYQWGGYPLGPVANTLSARGFLWNRGIRAESNWSDFNPQVTTREALQLPAACSFAPAGCLVPPLAQCRESSPRSK